MVPVEWRERSCLHPPVAELLIGIPIETTTVRSDHWHLEELELKNTLDHVVEVCPLTEVIAELHHASVLLFVKRCWLTQCPAYLPTPAYVDRVMMKGLLPGRIERRALFVAIVSIVP
jgi:hypothetical protein